MIEYALRPGGSGCGLSYYYDILTGCLRRERLRKLHGGRNDYVPSYFNRGVQFHALMDIWLKHGHLDLDTVVLSPADHPAVLDTLTWADTKILFNWFQNRIKPKAFGKVLHIEKHLGTHKLFGLDIPLSGIADLISEVDNTSAVAMDVMFQDLNLTQLFERTQREEQRGPIVMWDWKVVSSDDTASYIDGLQNVAYPMLAELAGIHVDAFVHVFVYRGRTQTYVLKSRKKGETERVENPNHKWWLLCVKSEEPSTRRQHVLESFLKAVQRRVQMKDGFPWPIDEPNPAMCRSPGYTCRYLEGGVCDRT